MLNLKQRALVDKFILDARRVHGDRYGYERVAQAYPKMTITCKAHGDFEQDKRSHLRGSGCPTCNPPFCRPSRMSKKWLDSLGLPDDPQHREVKGLIPGKKVVVDGFDPETNTVYEFYGDAFHGNPSLYPPEFVSSLTRKSFGQLNQERIERERLITDAGFKLVTMWEFDFKNPQGSPPKGDPVMTKGFQHRNNVLNLSPNSDRLLNELYQGTQGKGEGRIKCTITRHRLAKTAIVLGIAVLSKKSPSLVLKHILESTPSTRSGRKPKGKKRPVRASIVLECASTPKLLEGIDSLWRLISGELSHRRVTTACLNLGLEMMGRQDPGKVRLLVSKVCPVTTKYWDPELGAWL